MSLFPYVIGCFLCHYPPLSLRPTINSATIKLFISTWPYDALLLLLLMMHFEKHFYHSKIFFTVALLIFYVFCYSITFRRRRHMNCLNEKMGVSFFLAASTKRKWNWIMKPKSKATPNCNTTNIWMIGMYTDSVKSKYN